MEYDASFPRYAEVLIPRAGVEEFVDFAHDIFLHLFIENDVGPVGILDCAPELRAVLPITAVENEY